MSTSVLDPHNVISLARRQADRDLVVKLSANNCKLEERAIQSELALADARRSIATLLFWMKEAHGWVSAPFSSKSLAEELAEQIRRHDPHWKAAR